MTDTNDKPETAPPATAQPERPMPADEPVIAVSDAVAPDRDVTVEAKPMIDSSLVGEGGLPAADAARRGDAVPTPERTDDTMDAPFRAEEPRTVAPAVVSSPARSGFWPLALGGAVAALLGATAVWLAIPQLPEAWRPAGTQAASAPAAPEAEATMRTAAAEAARAALADQSAALADQARQAGAEAGAEAGQQAGQKAAQDVIAAAAPAAAPEVASAPASAPAVDLSALDEQGRRIAALEAALAQRPAQPAAQPAQPEQSPDTAALQQQVQDLAARPTLSQQDIDALRKLAAEAEATRKAVTDAADQAQARLASVQGEAEALDQKVAETVRRVDNVVAVAALERALASGSDGSAGAQLKAAGVEPPAPLATPIPPLTELQRTFPEAARAGLKAALREGGSSGGGLGNFLRVQTGARSLTPREGNDPDAILSRAGAAVGAGDIAAAVALVKTLPLPAQTAMQGWTRQAEAWAAAQSALGAMKTN